MPKTIKSITNPKLHLEVLTPQEVKKIHEATLWIIEKVGIRFPSKRALEIWAAHGAEVDAGKMVVRAKAELIEKALKTGPPVYPLAAGLIAGRQPRLSRNGWLWGGSDRHPYRCTTGLQFAGCA